MLVSKSVKMKWSGSNKTKYINLGYEFTKIGDEFDVNIEHLGKSSHHKVKVKCDICGDIIEKEWKHYIEGHNTILKNYDVCQKCAKHKIIDTNIEKYGVKSTLLLDDVKDKAKRSMKEKYGVENVWESQEIISKRTNTFIELYGVDGKYHEEIQDKIKSTTVQKYGVEYAMQSEDILNKVKQTNLEKYGCEYYLQTDDKKIKSKMTSLEKYGTEYPSQSEHVKNKVKNTVLDRYGVSNIFLTEKSQDNLRKSLIQNGRCMSSYQQREICKMCGGILNYPIDKYYGDICLKDHNIIIEYDGRGHDISVKRGFITQIQFETNEYIRERCIVDSGYSIIRLISHKDVIPDKDTLIQLIDTCIQIFTNSNNKIIKINIDDYIERETTE